MKKLIPPSNVQQFAYLHLYFNAIHIAVPTENKENINISICIYLHGTVPFECPQTYNKTNTPSRVRLVVNTVL